MTTTVHQKPVPTNNWQQRLTTSWNALFASGDLTTLIITIVLLLMPGYALAAAEWPLDMQIVIPVTILSVVFGFLLARSRYNELFALMISAVYGASFVLITATLSTEGGGSAVFSRSVQWLADAVSNRINQDELVFTLLVAGLFWFLGYNAAWHVFRIDRVWRVVLPPGLILVMNTVFYSGDTDLNRYLIVFMFLALILIARSNLDAREWDWYTNGIRVPRRLRNQFLRVGAALSLIVLLIGWLPPTGDLQERLDEFQSFMRSEPLMQLSEFWNRLFASIETEGPASADYYGGDSLELSGAIRLGDQEVFYVSAPQDRRYYWRSRVFSVYERGRWTPGAEFRLTTPTSPFIIRTEADNARVAVEQIFTIGQRTSRLIYAAPQPAQIDLPTRTDLQYTGDNRDTAAMNVSVIRPERVLQRGDSYTVGSSMSTATAEQLRAAGTAYPQWILDHPQYLNAAPAVMTDRTRQLAREIVAAAGATNPYDQAKAVETWLRSNIEYNETIPQPPVATDPIEWFLFDQQEGYCNYYATAMVVMLRELGIPSRMAAGFAQGTWDAERGAYVVRERDAHTWVEAYFPNYGWIEFEPTSAQAPLQREGDAPVAEVSIAQAPTEPPPTATPSLTPVPPTPTVSPTEDPAVTSTPTGGASEATPTITPTFTPSPTQTPVIVPTQPTPVRPEPSGPLALILSALGAVLLGLLVIALIVGLLFLVYWWWEWRGLRGLSPISRVYARLERYIPLVGVRFEQHDTPEERRVRTMRNLPGAERPVTAITRMYMNERYGPGARYAGEEQQQSDTARKAWGDTRSSILKCWLRRFQFWRRGE